MKKAQEVAGKAPAEPAKPKEQPRKKYVPLPHQDEAPLDPHEEGRMGELLSGGIHIERTG